MCPKRLQEVLHCSTTLSFDNFKSEPRNVDRGLPQGSPLSPILYLIYSAGLLTLSTNVNPQEPTIGFIDDTCKLVVSSSVKDNLAKLQDFVPQAACWSDDHNLQYDFAKYQLIHFTCNKLKESDEGLSIDGAEIPPAEAIKYLGVWLDRRLNFKNHVEYALGRGAAALTAVSRLKVPHSFMRQLVMSYVNSRVEYVLPVWFSPLSSKRPGAIQTLKGLGRIQRQATSLITGGLRTTAQDTLNYHVFIPPAHLCLSQALHKQMVRLCTLPTDHPLHAVINQC